MKTLKILAISFISMFLTTVNSTSSTLDEIVQSGVLKVGTTGDFPGWSFKNPETDSYEGFDIDVAKKLGESMGVKVEFCLLYTSPSPRDATLSRMPSSA